MLDRQKRLLALPKKDRLIAAAAIKRKEGRVLDSREKHAVKMTGEVGQLLLHWEKARLTKPAHAAERNAAIDGILKIATAGDKFNDVVTTPKVSRVLQSVIKMGSEAQRRLLLTRVALHFVDYANDGFAHYVILALVRHCTKESFRILQQLVQASMPSLVTHKFGMRVVQAVYGCKYANSTDRDLITIGIFKDSVAVMKGWAGYPNLELILEREVTHRKRLTQALFNITDKITSVKEGFALPFVQRLVCIYLRHGTSEGAMELVQTLRPHAASFVDTREGAELCAMVFSLLPPKDRKEVLRSVKEQGTATFACQKYAAPVICRMLDLVYDAQLSSKFIVSPLLGSLQADADDESSAAAAGKKKNQPPAQEVSTAPVSDALIEAFLASDDQSLARLLCSPYGHCVILHLLTPDAERKRHALPLHFFDACFNLYSRDNADWCHHTWRDAELQKPETVVICDRDASRSHMAVLPALLKGLAALLRRVGPAVLAKEADRKQAAHPSPGGDAADTTSAPPPQQQHATPSHMFLHSMGRIAKELLHLIRSTDGADEPYAVAVRAAFGPSQAAAAAAPPPSGKLKSKPPVDAAVLQTAEEVLERWQPRKALRPVEEAVSAAPQPPASPASPATRRQSIPTATDNVGLKAVTKPVASATSPAVDKSRRSGVVAPGPLSPLGRTPLGAKRGREADASTPTASGSSSHAQRSTPGTVVAVASPRPSADATPLSAGKRDKGAVGSRTPAAAGPPPAAISGTSSPAMRKPSTGPLKSPSKSQVAAASPVAPASVRRSVRFSS